MSGVRVDNAPAQRGSAPLYSNRFSRAGGALSVSLLAGLGAVLAAPMILAPLAGLAGLVAAPWPRLARLPQRPVFLWLSLAFLAWCGLSLFWTSGLPLALQRYGAVAAIGLGLYAHLSAADLLRSADRELAQRAIEAGTVAAVLSLALDVQFSQFLLSRLLLPQGLDPDTLPLGQERARLALSALSILLCGIGAYGSRRGWVGWGVMAGLILVCLWLAWVTQHLVAGIAILVALLCGVLALMRPELTLIWLGQIGALTLVTAPWLQPWAGAAVARALFPDLDGGQRFALTAQLFTWRHVAEEIAMRPLWGAGFDAARASEQTHQIGGYVVPLIPGDPSSFGLQVWLETGVVGVALAAGGLAALGRRLGALFARDAAAAAWTAAALACALIHASLEAGLWDGWFWAAIVIAGSIIRLSRAVE